MTHPASFHLVYTGRHGHAPQIFTPIQLNRYGGNKRDPDPQYDPHGNLTQILDVFTNVLNHMDYGLLSFGYIGLFEKDPRRTCYSFMFPITPCEIGPGFVEVRFLTSPSLTTVM